MYDTSIFPFLGSLTETTSTALPCALVKQSDQDEGVHEMTAMSGSSAKALRSAVSPKYISWRLL